LFSTEVDMFNWIVFEREFFVALLGVDKKIAEQVQRVGCRRCGEGRLDVANYPRKPQGALVAAKGVDEDEAFRMRLSFCCHREGCRRRTTPPSVRFLGRRWYLGVVVIVASVCACLGRTAEPRPCPTGVPWRTRRRWLGWWRGAFVSTEVFVLLCARLVGVAADTLPASIVLRLPGSVTERVVAMLRLLAPLTWGHGEQAFNFPEGLLPVAP
jgi:hypothetical protein